MRAVAVAVAVLLSAPLAAGQQAPAPAPARTIAPGDQLVAEGIPPIPATIAETTRPYTEARSAILASWHPTAREMLISTRFGNVSQIHRVAMPLGARRQLTFFDEPVGMASWDPRAGRSFVFARDRGGDEFAQLYRYDFETGDTTLLTDGGRSQNGGVTWSNAGDRIAYTSTRRNGADRDVYVMDPANPTTDRRIAELKGGGWVAMDWSPDDRQLLVGEYVSINESHLWIVDVTSGERTALTERGKERAVNLPATFTADGKGLWLVTDRGSEFGRLAYMDLATRAVTPITTDLSWDVDDIALSHDRRTLAFTTNEEGVSKLYLLDTASRQYRPVADVPVGIIGGLRWHRNGRELGFTVASSRSAADVWSLDRESLALTRWTESELGGLRPESLAEPRLIRWKSFDGRMISGFLYRPPSRFTGRRPVIINIHGGPEGQARPGMIGRNNYFLNELGIAMIFPNVRGSSGFGKTLVQLDNGTKRMDSVKDIGALLDWIAGQPDLDASRVMVTGGSYGGFMTLAVATNYNDRMACAVDVVGISHLGTFLKNTEAYRRDLRRVEYGDERDPAIAKFFDETAPLTHAAKITKPLFVVQGANDPRVPRSEAEQMVATVRKNGTPVWYLLAKDEGHGFRKKANADFQFYATVMFVRQFLLGEHASTDSGQ